MKNRLFALGGAFTIGSLGLFIYGIVRMLDIISIKFGFGTLMFFLFFFTGLLLIISEWDSFKEEVIKNK